MKKLFGLFYFILFCIIGTSAQMQLARSTGFPGINKNFQLLVHVPVDSASREAIVDDALINDYDDTSPQGWDGRYKGAPVPSDVYAYFIEVEIGGCKTEMKKGNVTIIR